MLHHGKVTPSRRVTVHEQCYVHLLLSDLNKILWGKQQVETTVLMRLMQNQTTAIYNCVLNWE